MDMDARDVKDIMDIMSDAHVSRFFRERAMVDVIMSEHRNNNEYNQRVVQNEALNAIIGDKSLMEKIMSIQESLMTKFEAREDSRKKQLAFELSALGYEKEAIINAIEQNGNQLVKTLTHLRNCSTRKQAVTDAEACDDDDDDEH